MAKFGIIGYPLGHSFSKKYFTEKFAREKLWGHTYDTYPLQNINGFPEIIKNISALRGLNVTIPHKQTVIPYLDQLDESAQKVGAVNVIKVEGRQLKGYNSDYYGFRTSLENWLPTTRSIRALILGTGGASKAVAAVLRDLEVPYMMVSRSETDQGITYTEFNRKPELTAQYALVINTTPLGMTPSIESFPEIPYSAFGEANYLYDLVYNPTETKFMALGKAQGAKVKNGLEMLHLQADKSWEIWNH